MHKIIEYLDDEMHEIESRISRGETLSAKELDTLKDLAKTKMAILTNEAMEEEYGGYSGRGGDYRRYNSMNGMSYARGRGRYAKRDSMGRYSSERGYSYAEAKEDMVAELKELAKKAPDEKTRSEIEHFANEMESK